jgi:hypothetical protein
MKQLYSWLRLLPRRAAYRLLNEPRLNVVVAPALRLSKSLQKNVRRPRVIIYYYELQFDRKARGFADLLRRRGFDVRVYSGLSARTSIRLKASADLWVGFWNFVPSALLPDNYIVMNAEPLAIKGARYEIEEVLRIMNRAKQVWDYSKTNAERLGGINVPVRFVPFGYAPYYEEVFRRHTRAKKLEQDIDVMFYGVLSERRRRALDAVKARGINLCVLDRSNPVFGEKLDELLARSKIILGLHYYDDPWAQIPDLARLDHLLSNGLFVIHEKPSADAQDPTFVDNVTTCGFDDIPEACAYFLAHPAQRAEKARISYEWFKSQYSLDAFIPFADVRTLLEQIR